MGRLELNGIDSIIFDLGMVIIDLDMEATSDRFKELFGSSYEESMTKLREKRHFEDYETGVIDSETFVNGIQGLLADKGKEQHIVSAWNAMLKTIPEAHFRILKAAMANYRTFCLSNTNALHIDFIYEYLQRTHQIENLDGFFEKVYLSHEMGMRKPDVAIFEFVIDQHQLDASRTLFIDDTAGHLKGARSAGLQTYHLQAPEKLTDILSHLIS